MAASLTQAMSSLTMRPCRASQRLSSARNGVCSVQRLSTSQPQQVLRAPACMEVITSKYKLKTRKAAAKRYHITGTGKVMRRRPGKQHINEKMSSDRLRKLGKMEQVADSNLSNVIGCLPYVKVARGKGSKDKKAISLKARSAKAAAAAAAPAQAAAPASAVPATEE